MCFVLEIVTENYPFFHHDCDRMVRTSVLVCVADADAPPKDCIAHGAILESPIIGSTNNTNVRAAILCNLDS
jgi:hypothetical protein